MEALSVKVAPVIRRPTLSSCFLSRRACIIGLGFLYFVALVLFSLFYATPGSLPLIHFESNSSAKAASAIAPWLQTEWPKTLPKAAPMAGENVTFTPPYFMKRQKVMPAQGYLYVLGVHSPMIEAYKSRYQNRTRQSVYMNELLRSVKSLRRIIRHLESVTLITDMDEDTVEPQLSDFFDNIIIMKGAAKASWGDKTPAMLITPYERTLLLDADTEICASVRHVFSWLKYFDMGLVSEPFSKDAFLQAHEKGMDLIRQWPHLTDLNSGVVLFKRSVSVRQFLQDVYKTHVSGSDQHYFQWSPSSNRGLLGKSNVRLLEMPLEYNTRLHSGKAPIYLKGRVRILHSRYTTCANVNSPVTTPRMLDPNSLKVAWYYKVNARQRSWQIIRNEEKTERQETPPENDLSIEIDETMDK